MGMELPNGKTARNIQEQVAFLTEKLKDLYAAFNELGIKKIEIVEELPETGQEGILYMLPVEDPETGNYYEEYIWLDSQWEMIGTTQIDLSNYATLDGENSFSEVNTFTTGILTPYISSNFGDDLELYSPETLKLHGGSYGIQTIGTLEPETTNTDNLGTASKTYKDFYLSGSIYFDSTHKINLDGGLIAFNINGNNYALVGTNFSMFRTILPASGSSYDLGRSDYPWKDIYLSGKITDGVNEIFIDQYHQINLGVSSGYPLLIWGSQIPRYNNSYNLGAETAKWKNLFLAGNLSDGTNSATVADIAALIAYAKAQGWIS